MSHDIDNFSELNLNNESDEEGNYEIYEIYEKNKCDKNDDFSDFSEFDEKKSDCESSLNTFNINSNNKCDKNDDFSEFSEFDEKKSDCESSLNTFNINSNNDNDSKLSCKNDIFLNYDNKNIPILFDDIYSLENQNQSVTMAAFYNYDDEKNENNFTNIYLPEIVIDYCSLVKVFFSNFNKGFSKNLLNTIWKSIKGLNLANIFLKKYEELNNIDRDLIPALKKIKLYKECSFFKITDKTKKSIVLNLEEFNNALGNIDIRLDGKVCSSVVFHLFSESLQIGTKIVMKFAIKNVPEHVRGVVNENNSVVFDFSNYI
jgi:hypothetical protein